MLNSSFCIMPWVHLHVDTQGTVKACCSSGAVFGNVNKESLSEIWNGEKATKFRENTLNGFKDKRCSICWKREAVGKDSIRTETLEKFPIDIDGSSTKLKPVYLDIRYSNICNLKCRTCWHGASSSWFENAKALKQNFGKKAIIKATTDNAKLIADILRFSDELEEIYFAGGEPLLMEEHYQILQQLINNNNTDLRIRYNTNLTSLKFKDKDLIALWKHFPNVEISASIDGVGSVIESIRTGLNWQTLIDNFRRIKEEAPHIKMTIAPTVSALNIADLCKLHKWFVTENLLAINNIYLNILDRPNFYNVKTLQPEEKQWIKLNIKEHISWLGNNEVTSNLISEFEAISNYMLADDWSHLIEKRMEYDKKLDELNSIS